MMFHQFIISIRHNMGTYLCGHVIKESAADLNESILRTRGARGISMNNELVKNETLLCTSLFVGTSAAVSLTVKSR